MARIVFTEPAEYDLLDIEYYIFVDLCNPSAAQRISDGILDTADKLSQIFYYYDVKEDVVYIIRVLYNKADWQNILKS